jgi:hypothetical protein
MRIKLLMVAVVGLLLGCGGPAGSELLGIKAQGARTIQKIERFRADSGRYPATLESARIDPPATGSGAWRYAAFEEGRRFELALTNDAKGWRMVWDSRSGDWKMER